MKCFYCGGLRTLAAALLLLTSLSAAPSPAQQQQSVARISDGRVKLGLILDLSGPYSDTTGIGSATAAKMAVEDFGGQVLGAPIDVLVADHGNSSGKAGSIARDWFANQQVDAIMDVSGSSEALIVQAIANTRDKIVILNGPGAERLTNEACTPNSVHYVFDTRSVAQTVGTALTTHGAKSWFFITVDYSFGYDLENDTSGVVTAQEGEVLGRARHPLQARDLESYLARGRQSEAKVIALANAGTDTDNAIRQAVHLGMIPGSQIFAGLSLRLNGVHTLGVPTTQGMVLSESFYWDQDDAARAWSKRFMERVQKMPNSLQAGVYSSTIHYLKGVAAAGTDETSAVMKVMKATPINDFFTHNGRIRDDGVMVHDVHLFQVKTPAESKGPWDYYKLVETVPGEKAFAPITPSRCPLLKR